VGLHWLQLWNSSSAGVLITLGIGSLKIRHTCKILTDIFGRILTEYMTKKAASVQLHHIRQCGTQELKFEVAFKDRARRGMRRQTLVKECILSLMELVVAHA
jgi:hypothetical protein